MSPQPMRDYFTSTAKASLPDQLPLVHTGRCEWAHTLIGTPELQPRHCTVYGEPLLYLFYGRPAYRIRESGIHDIAYCPICFILKLNRRNINPRRVLALDSGGVVNGHFQPHIQSTQRDLFELDASIDSARQLIDVVYKDNRAYMLGHSHPIEKFGDVTSDIVRRYIEMLHDPNVSRADDRRSAVEVQTSTTVSLKDDLQAIVLPEALLDDRLLQRTILEEWNALPITYPVYSATCPTEYVGVIRDRVMAFYEEFHIITKNTTK